tara:strand:+ start:1577 stop:2944 length:1368 start_codon:yes stop_codon:yes gene_type:complete
MLFNNSPLKNTSDKLKSPQASIKTIKFERKKDYKAFLKFIERESKALKEIKLPSLDEEKNKKSSLIGSILGLGSLGLLALLGGGGKEDPDDQPNKFDTFDPDAFKKSLDRQNKIASLSLTSQKAFSFSFRRPIVDSGENQFDLSPIQGQTIRELFVGDAKISKQFIISRKVRLNQFLREIDLLKEQQKELELTRKEVANAKKIRKKVLVKVNKEATVGGGEGKPKFVSGSFDPANNERQFLENENKRRKKINPNASNVDRDIIDKLNKKKNSIERRLNNPNINNETKKRLAEEFRKIQRQLGEVEGDFFNKKDQETLNRITKRERNFRKLDVFNAKMMQRLQPFLSLLSIKGTLIKDMLKVEPFADGTLEGSLELIEAMKLQQLNTISNKILTGKIEAPNFSGIDFDNFTPISIPSGTFQPPIDGNRDTIIPFNFEFAEESSILDSFIQLELEKY